MKKVLCVVLLIVWQIAVCQIKPSVTMIGGDDVPRLKKQFETTLETVLLEMNRIQKGTGEIDSVKRYFSADAFETFRKFVVANNAYTARRAYSPQMIERERGNFYDVRGVTVKIHLGGTEASDQQNLIFTFSKSGQVTSVRSVLPNYDFHSMISQGVTEKDSVMHGIILDFMEQFRMAYNCKDAGFLEKVYSDDALILVGSVIREAKTPDDMMKKSFLSESKVKLIQQTKREYLDGLMNKAFRNNAFINVKFDELKIVQHEKIPNLYGISCRQQWSSSTYTDQGYLFLMMDFRDMTNPLIHVRAWQPKEFEEDGSFVSLYDFDVVEYQ
jgi:hypothetical protein